MIKIRYYNNITTAGIFYGDDLISDVYLDVDIGRPTYIYEEQGDERNDGSFERGFARIEKQYNITTHVQEYMVDALTVAQLHDNIEVYTSNGTILIVKDLRVSDPEWQTSTPALAEITITFSLYEESLSSSCEESYDVDCDFDTPTLSGSFTEATGAYPEYIFRVICDGGEIVDEELTAEFFEELGATYTARTTELTVTNAEEGVLYEAFLRIDAGDWESQGIYTYAQASVGITVEQIDRFRYLDSDIKITAFKHGCDGVDSVILTGNYTCP